jgi:hypothetical protein
MMRVITFLFCATDQTVLCCTRLSYREKTGWRFGIGTGRYVQEEDCLDTSLPFFSWKKKKRSKKQI